MYKVRPILPIDRHFWLSCEIINIHVLLSANEIFEFENRVFIKQILVALGSLADLGISLDSKSADKELKAVTSEKSKACVTAFNKKLVTTFQFSRTKSGHIFLK